MLNPLRRLLNAWCTMLIPDLYPCFVLLMSAAHNSFTSAAPYMRLVLKRLTKSVHVRMNCIPVYLEVSISARKPASFATGMEQQVKVPKWLLQESLTPSSRYGLKGGDAGACNGYTQQCKGLSHIRHFEEWMRASMSFRWELQIPNCLIQLSVEKKYSQRKRVCLQPGYLVARQDN